MLKFNEYRDLLSKYPEAQEPWRLHRDWEYERAFRTLISLRERIPEELYGYILAGMYQMDTDEVEFDTLKGAFTGISREALMNDDDLRKFDLLADNITIYRGTQDPSEKVPRLSWSLKQEVAKNYARSHMFKAIIPKSDVIAYFSEGGDEEEILALVSEGFEILK